MKLFPYLTFSGNAADAIAHYQAIFGGEILSNMSFGDMPPQDWVTDDNKHLVAHAQIKLGDDILMISDSMNPTEAAPSGFSLNVSYDTVEEAQAIFAKLAEGGEISMPFEPTFWAKGFGVTRDKFGISWMVNCE